MAPKWFVVDALNVDSEARVYVVDRQKQSGVLFLGRGLYPCSHYAKSDRALARKCPLAN